MYTRFYQTHVFTKHTFSPNTRFPIHEFPIHTVTVYPFSTYKSHGLKTGKQRTCDSHDVKTCVRPETVCFVISKNSVRCDAVAAATTIHIIFAVTVKLGLKLTSADFVGAFQNAKLDTTVYFRPPPGLHCDKDEVWVLLMALYGLKNSPMLWSESLKKVLLNLDFKQADNDPCLFYKISDKIYILVGIIVDDLIIASRTRQEADELLQAVGKVYEVKNLGKPQYVIGIHIDHDEKARTILLNQKLYISNMAIRFGQQNAKQTTTAAATTTRLCQPGYGIATSKRGL